MSTTAMWLLLAVVVILILFFSVLYKRRFTVHELALTGVMAALSLVAYLFFRIPFYGGSSFHLGNTFTALTALLRRVKTQLPEKTVWCYTGYTYDTDLAEGGSVFTDVTREMLSYIDILVDGEFIEEQRDLTLRFRGSRNQHGGIRHFRLPGQPRSLFRSV